MSVENLFGDETHSNAKPIHIRIQSRNGRKCYIQYIWVGK